MNNSDQFSLRRVLLLILALVAILLVFVLLVDLEAVWRELRAARPLPLLLAAAALIAGLAAFALRWRTLLEDKPDRLFTFHAGNMGHAGNILLPFRAGEAIRVLVMGTRPDISLAESSSSFVVERLFEQTMRMLALIGAVLVGAGLQPSPLSVGAGILLVILGFTLIFWLANHAETAQARGASLLARLPRVSPERAAQISSDFVETLESVAGPRRFATVLIWSLVSWAFFWLFFYLTLLALDSGLSPLDQIALSLGALAISPPSAATQPGLFHASVVAPLAAVGYGADLLTAYAVLLHIIELVLMSALGAWGFWATKVSWSDLRDLFRPPAAAT